MRKKDILEKATSDIINYFKTTLGDIERKEKLDVDTTIVDFKSSDILIIRIDLIEATVAPEMMISLHTLSLDVILNGKRLLSKKFEGDESIIIRVCDNLKYRLEHLLEGFKDGRVGNNTQEKATV